MMKAKINGINLGFDCIGESKTSVVLIHGLGFDRTIWTPSITQYLQHHRVILPDVRGHGESDAPEGPYPMDLLAEDIAELLTFLGIKKAVICGHSMGGYISLAFIRHYPERVAGLGLITTRATADSAEKREQQYDLIRKIKVKGTEVLADNLAPKLSCKNPVVSSAHDIIGNTAPEGIIGALQGMAVRPDRMNFLEEIDVPALVVAGVEDQIVGLQEARQMTDLLKKARLLELPDAGHMPMLETPEVLGRA